MEQDINSDEDYRLKLYKNNLVVDDVNEHYVNI